MISISKAVPHGPAQCGLFLSAVLAAPPDDFLLQVSLFIVLMGKEVR